MLNTSGIIIVEGVRLFWRGEPSVINLAKELQAVIASAHIPPSTLYQQLETHLRQMILKMPVRTTAFCCIHMSVRVIFIFIYLFFFFLMVLRHFNP